MFDPKDPKRPAIRGRASIVECRITVKVLWRSQLDGLIRYLTDKNYSFKWDVARGDSIELDEYVLTVYGIHWAYNATAICNELEKCDYQDGFDTPPEVSAASEDLPLIVVNATTGEKWIDGVKQEQHSETE